MLNQREDFFNAGFNHASQSLLGQHARCAIAQAGHFHLSFGIGQQLFGTTAFDLDVFRILGRSAQRHREVNRIGGALHGRDTLRLVDRPGEEGGGLAARAGEGPVTDESFDAIFGFMFVLIGSIVMFTVSNTMNTAVVERTVEIGTLRALGFRRTSVLGAFLLESLLLGVVGLGIYAWRGPPPMPLGAASKAEPEEDGSNSSMRSTPSFPSSILRYNPSKDPANGGEAARLYYAKREEMLLPFWGAPMFDGIMNGLATSSDKSFILYPGFRKG